MGEFFKEVGYRIKRSLSRGPAWQKSLLHLVDQGDRLRLTADLIEAILRQSASVPPQKPDILLFARFDWETRTGRSRQLSTQLASLGHRIFYIQSSACPGKLPQLKKVAGNVYLISLPQVNGHVSFDSLISGDDIGVLRSSLLKIILAFSIHTGIAIVDLPIWRPLASQMCQEFGWKLVYDCLDEQARHELPQAIFQDEEESLLEDSDLVLFPSAALQQRLGDEVRRHLLLPYAFKPGLSSQVEAETAAETSWKKRAEVLDIELSKLFPLVSVIVVTFNKLEYTRMCLESVLRNTDYPNYEIILVDNASVDGSAGYLDEFSHQHKAVLFIRNHKNLGFAAANNQGANAANGDYLVFLNNDTIVTPGWLHQLVFHLIKNPSAGMVGPVTNAIGNEAKIEVDYKELPEINYFAASRANKYRGVNFEITVLALYCAMIPSSLYFRLGGLDERYQVGMFEDDDLALKIRQAGLKLICAEDVFIHHFHGISFNQFENQELQRIFHENKRKFEQKWGVTWQPHQNRPHID